MKVIVNSLLLLIIIIAVNSCGDSLGINDSDYIKSQVSDTIRIDTMINFKKITIEKIITKTDTVIKYITTNREYDPVYSNKTDFDITENYWNRNDSNITEKILPENRELTFVTFLDYNPLLPEFNLHLDMKIKLKDNQEVFKERDEVLSNLVMDFKKIAVFNNYPVKIEDTTNGKNLIINIEMLTKSGKPRKIPLEKIHGEIIIESVYIRNGQVQGFKLSGIIFTTPKDAPLKEQYSLSFMTFLFFPEI